MINFVVLNSLVFRIGNSGIYPRQFELVLDSDGTATVRNYKTKKILFYRLNLSEVQVNGINIVYWETLRGAVFNYGCQCKDDEPTPTKQGYFDKYFSKYFN